jgi:hypothetical protein
VWGGHSGGPARGGDSARTLEPWYAAQPWLEGRKPLQAARDLLQAGATASPLQRITAIELVDALGEPADAAWDEALAITNLAAHAREVLARSGNAVARKKEDARWLAAEYAAAALAEHGPDEAWSCLDELLPGKEFASLIRAVEGSDHPGAPELTEALNAFIASGEKPTSTRVCQLKISLKRSRSPIWRRVLVPATLRLDLLDAVIRLVMEWDGDHLHAFWVGRERYMTSSWRRCSISKPARPTPSVWQARATRPTRVLIPSKGTRSTAVWPSSVVTRTRRDTLAVLSRQDRQGA